MRRRLRQVLLRDRAPRAAQDLPRAPPRVVGVGDGTHRAPRVLANLLPQDLRALLGWTGSWPVLDRPAAAVAEGWGAVMLYRGLVDHPDLPEGARHVELVGDPAAPFVEGNHVFCSLSARGEAGRAPGGGPYVGADGEILAVGSRVQTQHTRARGGDDSWYAGAVLELHANRQATIIYDDGVEEVAHFTAADIQPTPDFGGAIDTRFITGMAKTGDSVKALIDLDAIAAAEGAALDAPSSLPPSAAQ